MLFNMFSTYMYYIPHVQSSNCYFSVPKGPDDVLFPAQEALLHIQTRIVDLVLDKDNFITTRLVVPSSYIECLDGKDASLSEIRRLTGANIQILPREELPSCVAKTDELVQVCHLAYSLVKHSNRFLWYM